MDSTRYRGDLRFLDGGGDMGRLIRAHAWAASLLGSPDTWPQGLRTAVRLMLNTRHPIYIFWGPQSICLYNDAYAQSLGPEQHPSSLGRPARAVWGDIWTLIGPLIEHVLGGFGATWHENQRVPITRHGKAEESYWTYSYGPIDDERSATGIGGVLVVCTETTAQVELAQSLAVSKERLSQALSAGGGIGTWDWDIPNDLVFADERFARLYGVDPQRAQAGAPIADFLGGVHPDDVAALRTEIDAAMKSAAGVLSAQYRLLDAQGETRWVLAEGACRFDEAGHPVRLAGVSIDITNRKRADEALSRYRDELESEVRQRTGELERANLALERANQSLVKSHDAAQQATRAKSAFLANVSHEIRTPMNAIIGLTHLLSRSKLDGYQRDRIGEVSAAAKHLLELIDDVLDLSKIEAGMLVLDKVDFSTAELLEAVVAMVRDRARDKGLQLHVDAAGLPSHLRGDKTKLSQIMINLLSNAVKFTDAGSVSLRARIADADEEQVLLLVEVEDTGPGIAPERQSRLFNAFEQVDSSLSRKHGGTGLGLALSRQLARAMGGDTSLSSAHGSGSTFRFSAWLARGTGSTPARPGAAVAAAQDVGQAERSVRERYAGRRVLLAEDNLINRFVAQEFLRSAGLVVETAVDGAMALAMAQSTPYDLVLMDMQMPVLDGLQATVALREAGHAMPIIAMTANAYVEDRLACLAAGMNDHITKPVEPEVLFSSLLRWLAA